MARPQEAWSVAMEYRTTQQFLDYYEKIRACTARVVGCIPRETPPLYGLTSEQVRDMSERGA
ncbi:MAG: hypothetical protein ACE5EO_09215 [Candidatus Krumholzibacteriia bacterium]